MGGLLTYREEFFAFPLSQMQCCFFPLHAYLDVAQEKTHQQLLDGIAQFEPNALHHTNTKERAILPDTSSESCLELYCGLHGGSCYFGCCGACMLACHRCAGILIMCCI